MKSVRPFQNWHFIIKIKLRQTKDCSTALKQDTAGDRTLSQQSQECHHRGLLLFVVAVRAKAKPGGTNKYLFVPPGKENPSTPGCYIIVTEGAFCALSVTKLKLENRKLISPIPSMAHNSTRMKFQRCAAIAATIPASLVTLKAFYPSQFGGRTVKTLTQYQL